MLTPPRRDARPKYDWRSMTREREVEAHGQPQHGAPEPDQLRNILENARALVRQPRRRKELAALLDEIEAAVDRAIVRLPRPAPWL